LALRLVVLLLDFVFRELSKLAFKEEECERRESLTEIATTLRKNSKTDMMAAPTSIEALMNSPVNVPRSTLVSGAADNARETGSKVKPTARVSFHFPSTLPGKHSASTHVLPKASKAALGSYISFRR
jgi:hypothetical protein